MKLTRRSMFAALAAPVFAPLAASIPKIESEISTLPSTANGIPLMGEESHYAGSWSGFHPGSTFDFGGLRFVNGRWRKRYITREEGIEVACLGGQTNDRTYSRRL